MLFHAIRNGVAIAPYALLNIMIKPGKKVSIVCKKEACTSYKPFGNGKGSCKHINEYLDGVFCYKHTRTNCCMDCPEFTLYEVMRACRVPCCSCLEADNGYFEPSLYFTNKYENMRNNNV